MGIFSTIFGGGQSKSQQSSGNQAYGTINSAMSPLLGNAAAGANGINSFLGGDQTGFNAYKDATGFDFMSQQGSRGITGNRAASGMLRSGGTGKALVNYGNNIQQQFAGNYMDRLLAQANLGFQAGNQLIGAGQQSQQTSNSSESKGLGGFLGTIGAGIAMSDRRLKYNIHEVGKHVSGLKLYQYRYKHDNTLRLGVMADEVAEKRPDALGPVINGYQSVDYDKLKEAA